ncbi:MAG: PH domain-containing protein [Thioploca sp.]|nr:PH domain-containing protein [Thioploca sp.]
MDEEKVLYDTNPAMFRNRPLLFLISLITGVGIVLILLPWWLLASNTRLTVTNERVTFKTGILAKNIREIFLSDIRSIQIDQTFQQRIFNTGKVEISSAATADAEISIRGIPNPYEVKRLIDEYRRKNLSAVD